MSSSDRELTRSSAFQEHEIKTLFGRKVAIDASMSIYQFLIAVRSKDGEVLTNEAGETTRSVASRMKTADVSQTLSNDDTKSFDGILLSDYTYG